MGAQVAGTSVRTSIVMDAPIELAFRVFTEQFDRIKPREHNMLAVDIKETVFEARVGGHIYDCGVDGSECHWARVLAIEPPNRIVFSWHINPRWQIETDLDKTSEVEVRFIARRRGAPVSSSSTETSIATAPVGRASATAWPPTKVGRCTCGASLI
jgi:uncharacterized protein YndB with AHSA1/START domain